MPALFPVTVCAPAVNAVHVAPVQEPFGEIEKVVPEVTLPSELFAASNPSAAYACEPVATMVALDGEITMRSREPTVTVKEAVSVLPPNDAVTVCTPSTDAVQLKPEQEPSGPIDSVAVTLPSELFAASNASTVYAREPPAGMVALGGDMTM